MTIGIDDDEENECMNHRSCGDYCETDDEREMGLCEHCLAAQRERDADDASMAELRVQCRSVLVAADHLAVCSERLLAANNDLADAVMQFEASDSDDDAVEAVIAAESGQSECARAVRSAVHEYRKRAARIREGLLK